VCEMFFSVDVCIYSIILCFSDCHDSTCAFLIVMLLLIYALFYRICDYFSVCVKCFNIDVRIYGTSLLLPPFFSFLFHPGFSFVILILMYAFIVPVLF